MSGAKLTADDLLAAILDVEQAEPGAARQAAAKALTAATTALAGTEQAAEVGTDLLRQASRHLELAGQTLDATRLEAFLPTYHSAVRSMVLSAVNAPPTVWPQMLKELRHPSHEAEMTHFLSGLSLLCHQLNRDYPLIGWRFLTDEEISDIREQPEPAAEATCDFCGRTQAVAWWRVRPFAITGVPMVGDWAQGTIFYACRDCLAIVQARDEDGLLRRTGLDGPESPLNRALLAGFWAGPLSGPNPLGAVPAWWDEAMALGDVMTLLDGAGRFHQAAKIHGPGSEEATAADTALRRDAWLVLEARRGPLVLRELLAAISISRANLPAAADPAAQIIFTLADSLSAQQPDAVLEHLALRDAQNSQDTADAMVGCAYLLTGPAPTAPKPQADPNEFSDEDLNVLRGAMTADGGIQLTDELQRMLGIRIGGPTRSKEAEVVVITQETRDDVDLMLNLAAGALHGRDRSNERLLSYSAEVVTRENAEPVAVMLLSQAGEYLVEAERLTRKRHIASELLPDASAQTLALLEYARDGATRDLQITVEGVVASCPPPGAAEFLFATALVTVQLEAHTARLREDLENGQGWRVQDPMRLRQWRTRLMEALRGEELLAHTAYALEQDLGTLVPFGLSSRDAARILHEQEATRLSRARLIHADADLCSSAMRRALRGRRNPVERRRIPCQSGLVVLDTPIPRAGTAPIVAMSWAPWRIDFNPTAVAPVPMRLPDGSVITEPCWQLRHPVDPQDGTLLHRSTSSDAWYWVTLWVDGRLAPVDRLPLSWETESLIRIGHQFPPDIAEHSSDLAMRFLVACWDLATQQVIGPRITEVRQVRQKPGHTKADRRRGVEDDGTLHLWTLKGRQVIPAQPGNDEGVGGGGPGTGGKWTVRVDYDDFDRDQCFNPRLHKELGGMYDPVKNPTGRCIHDEVTVRGHIRGPAGAPMSTRNDRTVYQLKDPEGGSSRG
ncbi:hypothetical protein [Streptacidiphilus cavernicola]|uniref:Uncharacterized protein n=1 Tax=Streptacidiphilus cavernicola TaxID=3342716 RepID=A0ABV6VYL9_9ACTN